MFLGRVRGSLVLNTTLPGIVGKKLRVLEEVDARDIEKKGNYIISFDYIGTGEGELVLYEGGPESAYAFFPDKTGSDSNILAIVDSLDL
jgi:microcompartment protein CcmK/EutM